MNHGFCVLLRYIPLAGLTLPHACAFPKPGPGFPTSYVVVFFVFIELKWEVVVRFVDIGGIIDHHYLHFLFIIRTQNYNREVFSSFFKITLLTIYWTIQQYGFPAFYWYYYAMLNVDIIYNFLFFNREVLGS